ncbi:hypothetical protein CLAIMM_11237 [Cladophialophora immunda]|nr:hypothetical protein CLAIMM_11237 [Cladophialophora immunda]
MPTHRNVVLMVADDLGMQLGCYGANNPKTPNLDQLAAEGTRFDMAFASTASCSGSRSVIYTGLHTHENGMWGLHNGKNHFMCFGDIETAPKLLNDAGYKTGIIGKVHVGPQDVFPYHVRDESTTRDVSWNADRLQALIGSAKKENMPFFATVGFVDPHRGYASRRGFGNEEGPFSERVKKNHYSPDDVDIPVFLPDLPEIRREFANYYQAIDRMDQGVGMILDVLNQEGVKEDTLVLFCADNGPPFVNSKTTLYDAGVHLPFIGRCPGMKPGVANPNLVSYIDILPTILDWVGRGSYTERRKGRSLLPIFAAEAPLDDWNHVFGSHTLHEITNYWPTRYMRTRRYKYHRNLTWQMPFPFATDIYVSGTWEAIRNSKLAVPNTDQDAEARKDIMLGQRSLRQYLYRPPEELYDLESDPHEVNNLARDPAHKDTMLSMRRAVEDWQMSTKDLFFYRDGVSVRMIKDYLDEGEEIHIPDKMDFDINEPSSFGVPALTFDANGQAQSRYHSVVSFD